MKHMNKGCRAGFTLIELIAVMGIIITMSLIVINSYVGIARVTASRAGARQLYGDAILARQHACTDGKDTYLYILSSTEYVICRKIGSVTTDATPSSEGGGSGNYSFFDLWTDLGGYTNQFAYSQNDLDFNKRLTLYDLTEDPPDDSHVNFAVVKLIYAGEYDDGGIAWIIVYGQDPSAYLEGKSADLTKLFKAEHEYGIGVYPRRKLPKGYEFVASGDDARYIKFTPTGASQDENGPNSNISIEIVEKVKSQAGKKSRVQIKDGKITVDYMADE